MYSWTCYFLPTECRASSTSCSDAERARLATSTTRCAAGVRTDEHLLGAARTKSTPPTLLYIESSTNDIGERPQTISIVMMKNDT